MTARSINVDDLETSVRRRPGGVRVSGDTMLAYDLAVLAADVGAVVGAAGGWLCDRVRAGWQVTVLTPADCDVRPLTILGVSAAVGQSTAAVYGQAGPAALALDARQLADDDPIGLEALGAVDGSRVEVTVWGESSLFATDRRFTRVSHRLSAAARAFKARALLACGRSVPDLSAEHFHSATRWYPSDGADLAPLEPRA